MNKQSVFLNCSLPFSMAFAAFFTQIAPQKPHSICNVSVRKRSGFEKYDIRNIFQEMEYRYRLEMRRNKGVKVPKNKGGSPGIKLK